MTQRGLVYSSPYRCKLNIYRVILEMIALSTLIWATLYITSQLNSLQSLVVNVYMGSHATVNARWNPSRSGPVWTREWSRSLDF